ncbi:MAG TPA: hypothetical protein VGB74_10235 [Actinoplanes sp.]
MAVVGAGLGIAAAAEGTPTVNCPQVAVNVDVPDRAADEVQTNLQLLEKQIAEANARIESTQGQGGDNFIQNSILGPLADKRRSTINRIETAIGRNGDKPDLNADALAVCTVAEGGGDDANQGVDAGQGADNGQQGGAQQGGGQQGGGQQDEGDDQQAVPGANLGILANSCDDSNLDPHDGFQVGNRCVSTEFGEVGSAGNNPSLLITRAPTRVRPGQQFTLTVSTRNLIRDRFLAAGQGGYYVESSVLQNGLVRGHFHTACRMLESTNEAPEPDPVPAFFVATEDGQGGARPDSVNIQVTGMPTAGVAQCASWAGDGSHRIPMMERANQTPALDVVRIEVR